MPQTKRQIEAMLAEAGARPNRRLGQNFLIDGNLMRKLVAAAGIEPTDVVLEVGAGTGSLTEMLLDRAGHVVAVEIDHGLQTILNERLASRSNLTLLGMDALADKNHLAPELVAAVRAAGAPGSRLMLVANLPYQIATPLIIDLLLSGLGVRRLCFTVQHELAERIVSPPGRKTFGPLSIVVQALCECTQIARLPASVFWPRPNVASTMLRLDYSDAKAARIADLPWFVEFVRACFLHRRKKLAYALGYLVGQGKADFGRLLPRLSAEDLGRRPEQLSVEKWIALGEAAGAGR